jgi:hypothetical protein
VTQSAHNVTTSRRFFPGNPHCDTPYCYGVKTGDLIVARYNWDVLSTEHPLAYEQLRKIFEPIDERANAAKRLSRRRGYTAIALGAFSLLAASVALRLDNPYEVWLSRIAAIAGLLSIAIGLVGVLHAAAKQRWLQFRYQTERLRQFHFQSAIALLPELLTEIESPGTDRFRSERDRWFPRFSSLHLGEASGARLGAILREEENEGWMFEGLPAASVADSDAFREFERSYRHHRLAAQIDYCDEKLNCRRFTLFPRTPAEQAVVFSTVAIFCIVGATALHVITAGLPESVLSHTGKLWLNGAVLWLAVAVLAIRALEEGLRPQREVERYQHYRSALRSLDKRLNASATPDQKIAAMKELEQVSFEEMATFLKQHDEALFVI